jgi:hypothetical protein
MRTVLIGLCSCALLVVAAACGGDSDSSGIERSRTVSSLSADEQMTLCEFVVEAAGGAGAEFTCGDDVTVTVNTVSECLSDFGADNSCTVGLLEDCANSDPCDIEPCLPLLECSGGQ